jgi:hypothetical protein
MKSRTCENINFPVYMCHLLPGVPGTMTDWLKIFQVDNRCWRHFYVMLSIRYMLSRKKLSDTSDSFYISHNVEKNNFARKGICHGQKHHQQSNV